MSGQLCGVCGAPLRAPAVFCGRCGAEQGLMIARDAGAGAELREPRPPMPFVDGRGLTVALLVYFAALAPVLIAWRHHVVTLDQIDQIAWVCGAAGVLGLLALGRTAWPSLGPGRWSARGAAMAIGAVAIVVGVVELGYAIWPAGFHDDGALARALARVAGLGLGASLLHAVLLRAIAEELAFRGVVLGGLRGLVGDRAAIAVSAILFAIFHLDVSALVPLALLGAVLGAVRVRSGSVWPCILLHAGYGGALALLHG